jgi:excisionase family DNA binding protein
MTMTRELITTFDAAKLLAVARRTLARWRREGRGPAYVQVGRGIRYRRKDIESFVRSGLIDPTEETTEERSEGDDV